MYIKIGGADDLRAHLVEGDIFTSLAVQVPNAMPSSQLTGVLESTAWGYLLQSDEVAVGVAKLRSESIGDDAESASNFDAMMDYAESKGWVIEDGRFVKAHIERV